jgi:membrane peptidoglycan carboxypeptidase
MKYFAFISLGLLISQGLRSEVSPAHVSSMLDQMVEQKVISKAEAEKAKARMMNLSSEQWTAINKQAEGIAKRSPASANVQSENKIEEVKGIDLDSAQFKQIQNDIGKIVPEYKD